MIFFKKNKPGENPISKQTKISLNKYPKAPTYLEGFIESASSIDKIKDNEWRRKIIAKDGNSHFKIKYYGQLYPKYNLITDTDFAPCLIYAEDLTSNNSILLFDGCNHGYNALFADQFSEDQINNRPADHYYIDKNGHDIFEIIISTHYNFNYDEEFKEYIDQNGQIKILNGSTKDFEEVKRNGYDFINIILINGKGQKIECVSEELA